MRHSDFIVADYFFAVVTRPRFVFVRAHEIIRLSVKRAVTPLPRSNYHYAFALYPRIAALAFIASSQLSALSDRTTGLRVRHLDAAGCPELARVSPHRVGHVARTRGFRNADSRVRTRRSWRRHQ